MSGELILIVEDDPNSRILLRDMRAIAGYRTIEVDKWRGGRTVSTTSLPAAYPHGRSIARHEIAEAGFDGFEQKPISVSRLLRLIRVLLRQDTDSGEK